jgi:hypothetical protein
MILIIKEIKLILIKSWFKTAATARVAPTPPERGVIFITAMPTACGHTTTQQLPEGQDLFGKGINPLVIS